MSFVSLYIAKIEKHFNAQYIASVFSKNKLAEVSKVYIQPYKNNKMYNRAYILLDYWYESEAAYSFIKRLCNSTTETRLVYKDDDWWSVSINNDFTKFTNKRRGLTIFSEPSDNILSLADFETVRVVYVTDDYDIDEYLSEIDSEREKWYENLPVQVDPVKTLQLRDVISTFPQHNDTNIMYEDISSAEMETYLREIEWTRNMGFLATLVNM